jgi:hypothetical protein
MAMWLECGADMAESNAVEVASGSTRRQQGVFLFMLPGRSSDQTQG